MHNILVVEDDLSVARAIAMVLRGPDCSVAVAPGVEEAFSVIAGQAHEFDVVVTDNKMPVLSGVELVRRLRASQFPGRIVVLSAYVSAERKTEYQRLGVDTIMAKPFRIEELRCAVGLEPLG